MSYKVGAKQVQVLYDGPAEPYCGRELGLTGEVSWKPRQAAQRGGSLSPRER